MSYIEWKSEFSTGINVIDDQHKRIIYYINQLNDVKDKNDSELIGEVLINLIDYTFSHFAFEESLMDDAGYAAANIHIKTHDSFRNKITDYRERHKAGEDIADELFKLLNVWLVNHIADDDGSYVPVVKKNIPGINTIEKENWLTNKIKEFFN